MNPRIVWNGNILDFPELLTRYDPDAQYLGAVNQSLSGKTETTTLRRSEQVRIALEVMSRTQTAHEAFYADLLAWWSWAARGNPWSFAYDAEKVIDTTLAATAAVPAELVANSAFDTWASDTDAGSWTETLGGAGSEVRKQSIRSAVFSGLYSARMTQGATGNTTVSQNITVTVSTFYQLRFRVKGLIAGRKIKLRITNTTTTGVLQNDGTWVIGGFTNEPAITTTLDWQTLEQTFPTESSGTTLTVAAILTTGGGTAFLDSEFCYVDWISVLPKQILTPTSGDGLAVGEKYLLREAAGFEEEIVKVYALNTPTAMMIEEPVRFGYASGDIVRSPDYYPALEIVDRRKRPFGESGAFRIDFDVNARNYVT